ncbi:VOC family protein [Simiduia aestuariiviva]|uniref:Catechol 2,3-dioxygenase-like lactoylglutathione lyase family enzyme n=1 Tax=Simiduia aestuariiviva TaxID=1510459 RepID=A0A839UTH7_9GAMM|nr:VOC family protein [Simiduia aestuariiviva]MBB3169729.1 catechol 2,3-dioxygenase-like lactoylglutathione lyase family enzyme [Simiduia aestuariiviva]
MLKIVAIDHLVLRTDNLEPMLQFYGDVLGCTLEREDLELGLYQLRAGTGLIDLVTLDGTLGKQGGPAPSAKGNNLDHLCLQIEPEEETKILQYLEAQGIEAGPFKERYGAQGFGPSLYLQDPDGNTVELRCHRYS